MPKTALVLLQENTMVSSIKAKKMFMMRDEYLHDIANFHRNVYFAGCL